MMVCSFPTTRLVGGDSIVANELARCYLQAGHKVTLVSISPVGFNGHSKSILGLDTIGLRPYYGKKAGIILREFLDLYDPKALAFLRPLLREEQPDCVHFLGEHNGVSAYGPMITRKMGIPAILMLHGPWVLCAAYNLAKLPDYRTCSGPAPLKCLVCRRPSRYRIPIPFRNYFIKKFVLAADLIVVASHFLRNQLATNGFPEDKVKVIPLGVETTKFYPNSDSDYSDQDDMFKILFVGRVRYKKGVYHLADACAALVEQGFPVQLNIIGDLPGPAAKNHSFVCYIGSVSREEIPRYYREADVLVQPSIIHEGFGLTLLEGMASGIPVIATNMGAMPEVVGDCGIIVPARDAQTLAQAIERLILDPDLQRRLGQEGRKRVERLFTWEPKAAEYLEYLTNLVDGNQAT